MLEQWQCSQHRMRVVRRRIYAAHLTVCRGIIEQLEQVEIDAFPTAFVTRVTLPTAAGDNQPNRHICPLLCPVAPDSFRGLL
jgi:hypothetical protein